MVKASNLWTGKRYVHIVDWGSVGDQGEGDFRVRIEVSHDEEGVIFSEAIVVEGDEARVLDQRIWRIWRLI